MKIRIWSSIMNQLRMISFLNRDYKIHRSKINHRVLQILRNRLSSNKIKMNKEEYLIRLKIYLID